MVRIVHAVACAGFRSSRHEGARIGVQTVEGPACAAEHDHRHTRPAHPVEGSRSRIGWPAQHHAAQPAGPFPPARPGDKTLDCGTHHGRRRLRIGGRDVLASIALPILRRLAVLRPVGSHRRHLRPACRGRQHAMGVGRSGRWPASSPAPTPCASPAACCGARSAWPWACMPQPTCR